MESSNSALAPVSAGRNALMGFVIGSHFSEHQALLQQLSVQGYDAAPAKLGPGRRIVLIKRDASGKEAGAFFLTYGSNELLESAGMMSGGRCFVDAAGAKSSAVELRDRVIAELGTPQLSRDDIEDWTAAGAFQEVDTCAYSAFWVAGPGAGAEAPDANTYLERLSAAPGPVASVSITPGRDASGLVMMAFVQVRA
jgi:hypothetical protein